MSSLLRNLAAKSRLLGQNVSFGWTISRSKGIGRMHKVNNLEKKFLVWTGKFKTTEEIPEYLPPDVVDKARNRMRIRLANYMMAATFIGCLAMVYSGKKAAERGESVHKMNVEWHNRINEEYQKEKAAAAK